ncbi:hypothetical protein DJ83_07775 [Halorubrum ezzemoulense]|uniref:Uracil-DNA glycosylase-like domain-containing protein n=1 Tax=Halorubrum ezzemoulense TaxID=337243 RepID=A0A256IZE9_HALEZ|nr:uracil-DNA glycosylase family protein [Halorubrum ezzemoulense]OYR61467.1 hypothetical protein DJ83_07775 [Halorubrum ezzemoulense]
MGDRPNKNGSVPKTVTELWSNWQQPGGAGPCSECPRHWSRRSDIPDQGQNEDPNNYGMKPWFAEGDFSPEVVVMGEEPGSRDPDTKKNQLNSQFKQTRGDIREVAEDSETIKQVKPLFDALYDSDIPTYWTNMTKCHPIGSNDNAVGQDVCCGLSEKVDRSYLRDELEELEPQIVITVGGPAAKKLLKLYGRQLSDFAKTTMSGDYLSGFHPQSNHNAPFEIATAFHPRYLFNSGEFQSRKSEIQNAQGEEQNRVKKPYYGQYGDDLVEWISTN